MTHHEELAEYNETMREVGELRAEIERLTGLHKAAEAQEWRELQEARAENDRLKAALQKIANNDFTMRDEMLTDSRPGPVWQAVARAALEPKP